MLDILLFRSFCVMNVEIFRVKKFSSVAYSRLRSLGCTKKVFLKKFKSFDDNFNVSFITPSVVFWPDILLFLWIIINLRWDQIEFLRTCFYIMFYNSNCNLRERCEPQSKAVSRRLQLSLNIQTNVHSKAQRQYQRRYVIARTTRWHHNWLSTWDAMNIYPRPIKHPVIVPALFPPP